MKNKQKKRRVRLGDPTEIHRNKASTLFEKSGERLQMATTAMKKGHCKLALAAAISAHVNARLAYRENEQAYGATSVYLEMVKRSATLLKGVGDRCLLIMPFHRSR